MASLHRRTRELPLTVAGDTRRLTAVNTRASKWGTFFIKCLPLFLGDGPHVRPPWGDMTAIGSSPYKDFPKLGVTRHYSFNISRSVIAPDGYEKDVLLINGAFPGPLIEASIRR